MDRLDPRRLALAIAGLALVIWVLGFAARGLFSGDSGIKLAQAHALWDSGFTSRSLPYDRDLDPDERYHPYEADPRRPVFLRKVDGERQGIYSVSFTAVAAPLVGVLGTAGMMLLGLAGGLAILLGVDLLLGRMGASAPARVAAAIATVGLTPVLLYAAQFAEHTPAVGLAVIALALVHPGDGRARIRPIVAGALVAAAATMRAECYLAVATVGVALTVRPGAELRTRAREGALYIAGALAVLVPYWGINLIASGTWDPVVTMQQAAPKRWANALKLLLGELRPAPSGWWLAILVAAAATAAAPPRRSIALGARIAVGVALVWLAWTVRAQTGRTYMGLFSVTPIAAYGLVASVWQPRWRPVWIFAVVTTLAIVVLNKSNDAGGLQLGARLLLPALPALIALAAAQIDADVRGVRAALAVPAVVAPGLLVALTALMMWRGVPPAYKIARDGAVAASAAATSPGDVVVTRVWFESQVLAPVLLRGKRIYQTPPRTDLRGILERLAARGVTHVTVIHKDPVALTLTTGHAVRTERSYKAKYQFHDLVIEPR
jgi:hypothetical protein